MGHAAVDLADQDFFFSYMAEYLDGELPNQAAARYESLLKAPERQELLGRFQAMRGHLQLALQSYFLKEAEMADLRSLVRDPALMVTQENVKIEELGRGEIAGTMVRRMVLLGVVVALVAVLFWRFGPAHEQKFKPLEYLGYEALALEEDTRERINLPSHDPAEIQQYLTSYPGLKFKPRMLKTVPAPWLAEGATVIDYEIAKVALVMYENPSSKEKLFHFSFAGTLSDLPASEPGNMRGLIFQTYASDELNLIAWQSDHGVVSLLVGRRSAPELAEIAVNGGK